MASGFTAVDGLMSPGPQHGLQNRNAVLIRIFTIGLGDDLDLEALAAMASKPEYFYRAPDAEDLKEMNPEIVS
jgi:hypothetical protein